GLATNVEINCKVDPCIFICVRWNEDLGDDELWSWTDLFQLTRELKYQKGTMWSEIKSYGYTPETLIIDSGTTFCDLFAYEIVKDKDHKEKGEDGKHMETLQISDYNLIGQRMFNILDMVKT